MPCNIANVLHLVNDKFKNIERSDIVTENEKNIAENIIEILNAHINGIVEFENELEFEGMRFLLEECKLYLIFCVFITSIFHICINMRMFKLFCIN